MKNGEKKKKKKGINRTLLNMFILLCFAAGAFLIYQSVMTKVDEKRTNETYSEIDELYNQSIASYEETASPVPVDTKDPSPTPTATPGSQPSDTPGSSETPAPGGTPESSATPEPAASPETTSTPVATATPKPADNQNIETEKPLKVADADLIPQREPVDRADVLGYFNPLLDINGDIRGYIKIPGTNISYPVVQGIDNDFYIERNIYGKKTISASIFMDYRNNTKELDDNTIIYGHNLNTTMFNDLDYFVDEKTRDEYYKNGAVFSFDTIYKVRSWEIYSAYIVDKDDFNYLITNFRSEDNHQAFLNETMERSFINTGIKVTVNDKILTLSTCNHWYNDSRTVIHARLITD